MFLCYLIREIFCINFDTSVPSALRSDLNCTIANPFHLLLRLNSGKTTQLPQLVLDDMIQHNMGADANIIVTQPRRISAIGVSDRVAAERLEKVGQTVGYSIRLDSKRSSKTRLLLCTTGVLLRRLQVDPDLASVSHGKCQIGLTRYFFGSCLTNIFSS